MAGVAHQLRQRLLDNQAWHRQGFGAGIPRRAAAVRSNKNGSSMPPKNGAAIGYPTVRMASRRHRAQHRLMVSTAGGHACQTRCSLLLDTTDIPIRVGGDPEAFGRPGGTIAPDPGIARLIRSETPCSGRTTIRLSPNSGSTPPYSGEARLVHLQYFATHPADVVPHFGPDAR